MRLAAGLAVAVVFAAALVYATLSESQVECEVCMRFGGRSACQTVAAIDRDRALAMAVSNTCSILTGGVTQGMECGRTPPSSVTCDAP